MVTDSEGDVGPGREVPAPGPLAAPGSLASVTSASWRARLALRFAVRGAKTCLVQRHHTGPLQVQRAFHPEPEPPPGCCHVYVLHPPGGLAGGDELALTVDVEEGAAALLTTPSATKFYRARAGYGQAAQEQVLRVAKHASLEWLPQETILFRGAEARLGTRVELSEDAAFLGWEIVCLGRPAAGERFEQGRLSQRFEIWRDGQPLSLERWELEAGEALTAPWGLGGQSTYGTFVCVGAFANGDDEEAWTARLQALRALGVGDTGADGMTEAADDGAARDSGRLPWLTASRLEGALVLRYLGGSAAEARDWFAKAWALLRPGLLGRAACSPRIWAT